MKRKILSLAAIGLLTLGSGCAHVKPWERSTLAAYTMRGDRDGLGVAMDEHMYFSREGGNGGRGVGGGGCGCN